MPILKREPDIHPLDLFDQLVVDANDDQCWWAAYTLSRREKDLMRRLAALGVWFYGPTLPKRTKSPSGRVRMAYVPLVPGYVFVYGTEEDRYRTLKTSCVSQVMRIDDDQELGRELKQLHDLFALDAELTIETNPPLGPLVRVCEGHFQGLEGTVLQRDDERRLVVPVSFIGRGVSLPLEECEIEAIG